MAPVSVRSIPRRGEWRHRCWTGVGVLWLCSAFAPKERLPDQTVSQLGAIVVDAAQEVSVAA